MLLQCLVDGGAPETVRDLLRDSSHMFEARQHVDERVDLIFLFERRKQATRGEWLDFMAPA